MCTSKRLRCAFIVLIFSFLHVVQAQTDRTISIDFDRLKKIEIIELIEQKSNYSFFFVESWLDTVRTSGTYDKVPVETILNEIFENSSINFYISKDDKIILTQNNIIRSALPKNFFENEEVLIEEEDAPVLLVEDVNLNTTKRSELIRIGKERSASNRSRYVLRGVVRNQNTGRPIPNLVINVRNRNINTVTDSNGNYSLELPVGLNIIETKALGIEDTEKRVVLYNNGTLNFNLSETSELLDELVIQADQDRNVKEAITGVSQIKIEEIKTIPLVLGERDILKVATTLPGIKTAGEGSSGYNVRGGRTDQNLILLDDGIIYNPAHFFGIFSALNPFTTGDVKIYKGNIPSEYGSRLASVFDIKTKTSSTEKFSGEASIGPVTSNLTLETPIKNGKSSLMIGGRGTYSNWILRSLDNEELKGSKASFYDIVAKFNANIDEKNNITATTYYSNDEFSITSDSLYSYSNRLLSFAWRHQFNSKNNLKVLLANSEYKFNIEYEGDLNGNFDLGYKINETQIKLKMNYLHSDKHKFNYGLSTKLYAVNPGSRSPLDAQSIVDPLFIPKERALESALFVADDIEIDKNLSLNLGLRYSVFAFLGESTQRIYTEGLPRNEGTLEGTQSFGANEIVETYGGPEFRMSARYLLGEDFSIKAGYNSTYQYIHTLSNNTTVSPTDTWKLSDINIEPQRGQQVSLGLFKNIQNNNYELSLEGYYKKSKNILDYKVGANLLLNETIETEVLQGEGKAYGVEFLIKKNEGRLNGWLGYTYSRSFNKLDSEFAEERVNNGNFFPSNFDKPHDLNLVANYKLTDRFSLSTNFTYQTGRPVTYPVGNFILNGTERVFYSDRNKFRIPDYYRLDIGLNIEGNHKIKKFAHSFWNISVYNVLGRNNPYSVFFVTENNEIKAYKSSIFAIPVPTITYNFRF